MAKVVNRNNYRFMSEKFIIDKLKTKSLAKLNLYLYTNPKSENRFYIAAFLFFNQGFIFLDENKHQELIKELGLFERRKENDGYSKAYNVIDNALKIDQINKERKEFIIDQVNELKNRHGFSFNSLFKEFEIKYSNGYNFFVKRDCRMFTIERANELLNQIENKYK